MKIDITARHSQMTDKVKEYAIEKVTKLEKYYDRINGVKVILEEENNQSKVELVFGVGGGATLVIEEKHADLMAGIDLAVDKMQRQLRKYKEKLRDRSRQPKNES